MGQAVQFKATHALKSKNPLWMAAFGIFLGLSAPGYGLWWLAWVALTPALFWAYRCPDFKKRALGGFLFGFCFQAVYCLWFFDLHPLTWLGFDEISSRLVTLAGWLLIGIEGGLLTGVFFLLYQAKTPRLIRLFGFPLLWICLFLLLNTTPLALPWGLLEYTQAILWPMRWLAGGIGGLAITALVVLHNIAWAEILLRSESGHQSRSSKLFLGGALIFPGLLLGLNALPIKQPRPEAYPMPVAIIQANLPIEVIRSGRLSLKEIEPAYLAPIREASFPAGTLVLLPEEGVIPGIVLLDAPDKNRFFQALRDLAQQKRFYIAVGVSALSENRSLYNSIALISPHPGQPVTFYNKRRLVPFGEYTPYELGSRLTSLLNGFQVEYSAPYSAGTSEKPLMAGSKKLGGLLCFELIDAFYAKRYEKEGVNLLINLSNLGWFHQNPLIEAQFLAVGQLRAAESGIPLAIASNTGISAILSHSGEILKRTTPAEWLNSKNDPPKSQILFHNQ